MSKRKTNEEFQKELKTLREQGNDVYTDDKYIDNKTELCFYCSKGHRWPAQPKVILCGHGCPYCSGRKPIIGETSLWDTRPDIAYLLLDSRDGYRYSAGSGKTAKFVCPVCKTVHEKKICTVCWYGFVCNACGDGVSYPEKFMRNLLTQLKVEFKQQVSKSTTGFDWIENGYRYDFYVEYFDLKVFIETDGGLNHGKKSYGNNDVSCGLERDIAKDKIAISHNIKVIRIDCDYPDTSERFRYIKNNILCSDLNAIFDLSAIDWIECDKYAQTKMVPIAASLYNDGLSMYEIRKYLGYHEKTVRSWLKQATALGLCNYDAHEMKIRGARKVTIRNTPINQYSIDDNYIKTYASIKDASKQLNIPRTSLMRVCDGESHIINGYKLYRASSPDQPDRSKIIITIQN